MNKENLVLITINTCWADEMDIGSFGVFTERYWQQYEEKIEQIFIKNSKQSHYVGSNQKMTFNGLNEYRNIYSVKNISSAESDFLCKTFNIKVNEDINKLESVFGNWVLFRLWAMTF